MSITIKTDAKSLLETFAALKKIPMQKVIRNAARDFTQAAIKATPKGTLSKSPYARLVLPDGTVRYIHIEKSLTKTYYRRRKVNRKTGIVTYTVADKPNPKRRARLNRMRLPMRRGWSKASWIGVFRALGVEGREPSANRLPKVVETIGTATMQGSGTQASVTITDDIHFTALNGMEQTIVQAGHQLAASRIVKEFNRMITRIVRK